MNDAAIMSICRMILMEAESREMVPSGTFKKTFKRWDDEPELTQETEEA